MNQEEIERIKEYNRWRAGRGMPPVPSTTGRREGPNIPAQRRRYKSMHAVNVTSDAWLALDRIAQQYGYFWGSKGNVSQLLQSIGEGYLVVSISPELRQ
jgi:hypothetical protein